MSKRVSHRVVATNRWLRLAEVEFEDPCGGKEPRKWELVERTTTANSTGTDACDVFAVASSKAKGSKALMVISQYRPPVDAVCLELPAGLVDEGEDPTEAALRELKEETGFVGAPKTVSPQLCYEPGLASSRFNLVSVDIDLDAPENANPQAQPDEGEVIQVHFLPIDDGIVAGLDRLCKELGAGTIVDGKLYTLGVGLDFRAAL